MKRSKRDEAVSEALGEKHGLIRSPGNPNDCWTPEDEAAYWRLVDANEEDAGSFTSQLELWLIHESVIDSPALGHLAYGIETASMVSMQTEPNRPALILVTDSNSDMESEVDIVEYAVWATSVQMTVYPPEMRTWSKHLAVLDAYLL